MEPEHQEKEAMRKLRQARKAAIEAATARMKEQRRTIEAIKAELQKSDRTVPEIAAATGIDSASVLWYLATLKKYGEVAEAEQDGSYFRYRLAPRGGAEE